MTFKTAKSINDVLTTILILTLIPIANTIFNMFNGAYNCSGCGLGVFIMLRVLAPLTGGLIAIKILFNKYYYKKKFKNELDKTN